MLIEVTGAEALELERGSTVVCIVLASGARPGGPDGDALATARSVLGQSDAQTPILIAGPADRVRRIGKALDAEPAAARLFGLALQAPLTQTQALNAALLITAPADVALVTPGIRVYAGWLGRLRAAAVSDSTVASASPLSIARGALALFGEGQAPEPDEDGERDAALVRERGLRLYPRTAAIGPGCAYVRRSTFELLGALNEKLELPAALEELAARAIYAGMLHVLADDVLVAGGDESPASGCGGPIQETLAGDERGRLHRAVGVGRGGPARAVADDRRARAHGDGRRHADLHHRPGRRRFERREHRRARAAWHRAISPLRAARRSPISGSSCSHMKRRLDGPRMSDVVHRPQQVVHNR